MESTPTDRIIQTAPRTLRTRAEILDLVGKVDDIADLSSEEIADIRLAFHPDNPRTIAELVTAEEIAPLMDADMERRAKKLQRYRYDTM
jgi:hypothetical protein